MGKVDVIFRVDVGEYSGLGHFYRCFALAEIIKSIVNIKFSLPLITDQIKNNLIEQKFTYEIIESPFKFIDTTSKKSVIILDGYYFNNDFQEIIIKNGHYLILIDDLCNDNCLAHAVINSDPYVYFGNYQNSKNTKLFLGLKYMIARPSFFENRNNYKYKNEKFWFLSFGGTSNLNLYLKYLTFLDQFNKLFKRVCENITIVINNSKSDFDELSLFVSAASLSFTVDILRSLNTKELITLMDSSKFAILPGSGILREAALRNVFCLTGYFAENQKPIAKFMDESSIAINMLDLHSVNFLDFTSFVNKISEFSDFEYKNLNSIFSLNQIKNLESIFRNIEL
jgi:UDP-2,4-diacetamido-2,4,6-trideoxy-beta-L-altropyranose hydrolase